MSYKKTQIGDLGQLYCGDCFEVLKILPCNCVDAVLDPFAGSFTTGIACILLDRNFIGIEKEEEYIKIGKARMDYWQKKRKESLF